MVHDAAGAASPAARPLLSNGPATDPLPYDGSAILAQTQCEAKWKPFKTLERATAVWSPSNVEYEYYGGVDLEPEHEPWPEDGARRAMSRLLGVIVDQKASDFKSAAEAGLLKPGKTGQVLVGECTAPSQYPRLSGTWHTQRIGPFTSYGGFDWHQFSWVDPSFLWSALPAGGGAAGVLAHFSGPVDAHGKSSIPYPPIHQHHTHVVPNPNDVFLNPLAQWTHNRLFVIHGETHRRRAVGVLYPRRRGFNSAYIRNCNSASVHVPAGAHVLLHAETGNALPQRLFSASSRLLLFFFSARRLVV